MDLSRSTILPRRVAAGVLVLLASACTDRAGVAPTLVEPPLPPAGSMAVLTCVANVAESSAECFAAEPGGGVLTSRAGSGGPSTDVRTLGGQGQFVRLASSNVTSAGGTFSMDVTVQNLSNLALGTSDGATPHAAGLRVFFHSGPTASPSGTVTVANADGTAMFTGADQPYFEYAGAALGGDEILSSAEVSTSKSWQFSVVGGVTSFSFTVYVRTESPPGTIETVAPQITAISATTLVPGEPVTLTGINFDPNPANNTVRIGGVAVPLQDATATQLLVVVPCMATATVGVQVEAGGMAGVPLARALQANQRTIAVGDAFVATAGEVECNELTSTGVASRYLVAVYSSNTSPSANSPFEFLADGLAPARQQVASPSLSTGVVAPALSAAQRSQREAEDAHYRILEENGRQFERLSARFRGDGRMRPSRNTTAAVVVAPPLTRTFRIANLSPPAGQNICSSYYVVSATRVFYDGKLAIYEDDATPAAFQSATSATMASNYQRIGDQFNADMEPIIRNNFGDVLRRDAITDNNGVLVALFTPHINNNVPGVAGFVVSCDQFPNDDANSPGVGGPYTASLGAAGNGASNFGEFFYAYQPTVDAAGYNSGNTPDNWYRTVRSTFIHETKHVASQAARVANGAPAFEESWLEEGTARHSEELWMREAVDGEAWKSNIPYGSFANPINLYCDVRPGFAECDANTRRPASIMQRHFTSLYTFLNATNARLLSPFGRAPADNASYFYAISWSLVRYAVDRYGVSDADFLTALTQSSTSGVANLSARTGVPTDELLGGWALALVADDYPGLGSPGATLQMPTWNFRSIYSGLNADFPSSYTRVFPQEPGQYAFGSFTAPAITTLRGGGVLWYEVSGTQTAAQMVRLQGSGGAALPSDVRVAIARVQ